MVHYIVGRGSIAVDDLARHYGITPKQAIDDVNQLWVAGEPGYGPDQLIDFDGFAFEDGVIRVTEDLGLRRPLRRTGEQIAVLIAGLRAVRSLVPEGDSALPAVDSALSKLARAGGDLADSVEVQVRPHRDPRMLVIVSGALDRRRQLRIRYVDSADVVSERVVEPLDIDVRDDATYLRAWCHRAEGLRTFRVDRILAAEELDDPVRVTAADLADAGTGSGAAPTVTVSVRVRGAGRWIGERLAPETLVDLPGGGVEFSVDVQDPRWLRRLLLAHGDVLEAAGPAGAIAPAVEEARAAQSAYRRRVGAGR